MCLIFFMQHGNNHFPLAPFLAALTEARITTTLADYQRIQTVLMAGGPWTRQQLRDALQSLLVRNPDHEQTFQRLFDSFFHLPDQDQQTYAALDLKRALDDLTMLVDEKEVGRISTTSRSWTPSLRYSQRRNFTTTHRKKWPWWIVLVVIVSMLASGGWYWWQQQTPNIPVKEKTGNAPTLSSRIKPLPPKPRKKKSSIYRHYRNVPYIKKQEILPDENQYLIWIWTGLALVLLIATGAYWGWLYHWRKPKPIESDSSLLPIRHFAIWKSITFNFLDDFVFLIIYPVNVHFP